MYIAKMAQLLVPSPYTSPMPACPQSLWNPLVRARADVGAAELGLCALVRAGDGTLVTGIGLGSSYTRDGTLGLC